MKKYELNEFEVKFVDLLEKTYEFAKDKFLTPSDISKLYLGNSIGGYYPLEKAVFNLKYNYIFYAGEKADEQVLKEFDELTSYAKENSKYTLHPRGAGAKHPTYNPSFDPTILLLDRLDKEKSPLQNMNKEESFYNPNNKTTINYKEISKDEFNKLYEKFDKKQDFTKEEMGFFLIEENGIYTAIDNSYGNLFTEDFKEKALALRYLSKEGLDKLRDEECCYEVGIYETKEDYENGEPFQEHVYSSLEEATKILDEIMENNNFYSGFVLNQNTGIEEYAYLSDEQQKDEADEEEI